MDCVIPMVGGPLDGMEILLHKRPKDGSVWLIGDHDGYEFDYQEWQWKHYWLKRIAYERDGQHYVFVYTSLRILFRATGRMTQATGGVFTWRDAAAVNDIAKERERWFAEQITPSDTNSDRWI